MLFYLRNLLGNYVPVDSSITILFYLRNLFDTYDPFDSSITMLFFQVKPTVEETWDGLKAMADAISKEYPPQ